MLRKFIFKDGKSRSQLTLPVTPQSFQVGDGREIQTVNVHEVGEVAIAGGKRLGSIEINCMFPASRHPFGGDGRDPYDYVEEFVQWMKRKKRIRFIVSDTNVNREVLVESISYGEQDGTNDVYANIQLREYQGLDAVETTQPAAASKPRTSNESGGSTQGPFGAVYGDTFCGYCRKYYGDGSYALATKLAAYNGHKNPNVLYVGDQIVIPPREQLEG